MTETEMRQFLVKHLGAAGYDVQRNESGAINEGYPDLTISRNGKSILLELKRGHVSKEHIIVEKYRPRQKGKQVQLACNNIVRILVVTSEKLAYLLSAPFTKFRPLARCVRWRGTLEKTCQFGAYLNSWWEDL